MKYGTNYKVAVNWLGNQMLSCGNLPSIDQTIWDNARFSLFNEDGDPIEIFNWLLTDCEDREMRYLEETFGLLFTYSELLEKWVLCVDHWGTSWDYVYCETTEPSAARALGEGK